MPRTHLDIALALALVPAVACGGGSSSSGGGGRTVPQGGASSVLADTPTGLAADAIKARLPRGTVTTTPVGVAQPGMLAQSVHTIARGSGNLRITAKDVGRSAGDDFATAIVANEQRARCAEDATNITAVPSAPAAAGFSVVVFTPDAACNGATPPAARLWVKAPDATVFSIVFECEADGCMPDRGSVVDAFVGTLAAGTPPTTAAGTRTIGPSPELSVSVTLPEGYLIRGSEADGSVMFEIFKRHALGEPSEGVSFSFLATRSPNQVRDDYAREGARARNVNGTLLGHRTRFVEHTFDGTTERIGRVEHGEGHLDVVAIAASEPVLTELMAIVSSATHAAPAATP